MNRTTQDAEEVRVLREMLARRESVIADQAEEIEGLWNLADRKNRQAVALAEAVRKFLGPTYHCCNCESILCSALASWDAHSDGVIGAGPQTGASG